MIHPVANLIKLLIAFIAMENSQIFKFWGILCLNYPVHFKIKLCKIFKLLLKICTKNLVEILNKL